MAVRDRTYADWLRHRTDDELVATLELRPDLTHPPPDGLADLAARATTGSSVARVLRHLNAWQEIVVAAVAALGGEATPQEIATILGVPDDTAAVGEAVEDLRQWALVWGSSDVVRLVREARLAVGPFPGGLAPASSRPLGDHEVDEALATIAPEERALLDRLVWGPPTGRVRDAAHRPDDSPVARLLRTGLLRLHDADTVILPREVAWRLRSPAQLAADQPGPTPPTLALTDSNDPVPAGGGGLRARLAAQGAVATAAELVHDVEACCEWAAGAPLRLLRDEGLGVRDLHSLSRHLSGSPERTGLLLELTRAAGLVTGSAQQTLVPTTRYDRWLSEPTAERWAHLASAWLDLPRWPSRGLESGGHVLGTGSAWAVAPDLRRSAVARLRTLPVATVTGPDRLTALLGWLRPGWARAPWSLPDTVDELWPELQWLGLLGEDNATTALLAGVSDTLPADVATAFPAPVAEVIVQADLTAVAPGPLQAEVARALRLLAEQESRGAGAVFRFSASTIRRAFDAGWSQDEILQWLAEHSVTPIPQPLAYLVSDTARRHGAIRVGTAWCYVRTEDEAQASTVLAHPAARALGLRSIAPGVLVANTEPDQVVAALHEMGLHPAAEDESGRTVPAPEPVRAQAPRHPPPPPAADPAGVVAALRAGERRRAELVATTDDIVATVQGAYGSGSPLRVDYVRADGTRSSTTAVPVTLASGTVRLTGADGSWTIPLSRIVAAGPVEES